MKNTLFLLLLLLTYLPMFSLHNKANSNIFTQSNTLVDGQIDLVGTLMAQDKYDSALLIVSRALVIADSSNYIIGKYYLYAFESEILYYHSLFSPALNSAYAAIKFSETIHNDTLTGSIQNLIGLLLSNLNDYDNAKAILRSAIKKLPLDHGNPNLSYRFHATSNICEVFLLTQQTDSAIKYARLSLSEAMQLDRKRAIAINYWNLSKAYLLQNNYDSAYHFLKKGQMIVSEQNISDARMFFNSLEAEIAYELGKRAICINLLKEGIHKVEQSTTLTMFSKIDFLNEAIQLLINCEDFATAVKAQVLLSKIKMETDAKRNSEQIKMLERFYNTKKQLEISESLHEKREAETRFQKLLLVGIVTMAMLVSIVIAFVVFTYMQRQNIKTMQLQRDKETLSMLNEKQKAVERVEAANHERNRIAKELHDDIGSSLSSISLYSDLALHELKNNSNKSFTLMQKVNEKSKELSESMSDIIWAVYSKNDSFNNLMMRMKNFAFEMVTPLNIEVDFSYPFQLDELTLNTEQRKNVYYIFKEAVNNAVKHSGCTLITILVTQPYDKMVCLTITDNGKGFDINTVPKNNGFYTMQTRAKAVGGSAITISEPGKGTVMEVRFQLT